LTARTVPPRGHSSRAVGFSDDDLKKPLVGVAHCWIEITPCNWNHRKLAEEIKPGIRAAGGTPIEFNTISVTDGIAMGTEGMKASLVSRETIADSVELVVRGHLLDAFVGISGCDKTIPGMVMAMARLNIPSVMLYSGSIAYGEHNGKRLGCSWATSGRNITSRSHASALTVRPRCWKLCPPRIISSEFRASESIGSTRPRSRIGSRAKPSRSRPPAWRAATAQCLPQSAQAYLQPRERPWSRS